MKIDYDNKSFSLRGREFSFADFKAFYMKYYPVSKYQVKDMIDWQAVLYDVQANGILEIFEDFKIKEHAITKTKKGGEKA